MEAFVGSATVGIRSRAATGVSPRRRRWGTVRMDALGEGIYDASTRPEDVRVLMFGSTGYIGQYVTRKFIEQGYKVSAVARERSGVRGKKTLEDLRRDFAGGEVVAGDVTDAESIRKAIKSCGLSDARSTVMVSCLASRSGGIKDSNRIDYAATLNCLEQGYAAGARHFVLLSAICVQKPLLEFQRAKLRLEAKLQEYAEKDPSFSYSIVRPTAFFKSLAAQVPRVKKGSSYIMFNDGELCKCNPISETDLAEYMVSCAVDAGKRNQILPVGGPEKPVTPKQQAEILFRLLNKSPKYQTAPIGTMDVGINVLDFVAKLIPPAKELAEFGRIGKYYATEDMVGPSYGKDTLEDFFKKVIEKGMEGQELGSAASVFRESA